MGWNPFKKFGSWFEKKIWKPVTGWVQDNVLDPLKTAGEVIWSGIEGGLDFVTAGLYSDLKDLITGKNEAKGDATQAYQDGLWELMGQYESQLSSDAFASLDSFQTQITDYNNKLNLALKDTIPEYQEWLSHYQGMLNGEDNILSQEREGMVDSITNAETALNTYEITSALQVKSMFDDANEQVASAKKEVSLANVAASATGTAIGAYKTEALKVQSDIRRYVGSDGYLNEETGQGEIGTFAASLMDARNQIRDQKNNLQLSIDSLKLTLNQWDDDMERLAAQTEIDLEVAQENVELWKDRIEQNKIQLQLKTEEALDVLSKWEEATREYYKSTGEKSTAEVDALVNEKKQTWKDLYSTIGVDLEI